jgi:two-component system, LytTR family, response regulator
MSPIRVMIADDEPLAVEGIAGMLANERDVQVVGTCADGEAALAEIRLRHPDLVFLDVQMPRLDGIGVLARLDPAERPVIIFVTAYERYAVQAFELCALDYLLKPFRDARFKATLNRARERIRGGGIPDPRARMNRLAFKAGRDHLLVNPAGIVWIEAQGDLIRVAAGGRIHLVRESIRDVERRLSPAQFFRVHRSFIVNVEHIVRITPALYGDLTLVMDDGVRIRLSRSYRGRLKELLPGVGG